MFVYILIGFTQHSRIIINNNFCNMENCLLCLELQKEFVETVGSNSKMWQELNVTYILEKHLWPMVSERLPKNYTVAYEYIVQ